MAESRPEIKVPADGDLNRYVEAGDGIHGVQGTGGCHARNDIGSMVGRSSKNVGATKPSTNVATIPPGEPVAFDHIHVTFEQMLYMLQGCVRQKSRPGLTKVMENEAGDCLFIEPGVPRDVFNLCDCEPDVAVVARFEPDEWQNIIPYDRHSESAS
jgi:uncharacterized RmlC-like cupin family protein